MDDTNNETQAANWPLWKPTLRELRAMPNFGYGLIVDTAWFEKKLGCLRKTETFAFQMIPLRAAVESEDGYYLQCQTVQDEATGAMREVYQIPCAADHEAICKSFEQKMRGFGYRSVRLRLMTLNNPKAQLTEAERTTMEANARIAATRMLLIRRERSIAEAIRKYDPKLLAEKE